jgi:hypothetical protein
VGSVGRTQREIILLLVHRVREGCRNVSYQSCGSLEQAKVSFLEGCRDGQSMGKFDSSVPSYQSSMLFGHILAFNTDEKISYTREMLDEKRKQKINKYSQLGMHQSTLYPDEVHTIKD